MAVKKNPKKIENRIKKYTDDDIVSVKGVKYHQQGWYHLDTPGVYYETYIQCAIATHGNKT